MCIRSFFMVATTLLLSTSVNASTVLSFGSGSAVAMVDAAADFESSDALNSNPYIENGLVFSRTDLTFNNNGCGYAGCTYHAPFAGFIGNYMYGTGSGYFEMTTVGSDLMYGLEFQAGTGSDFSTVAFSWETFKDGLSVSSGTFNLTAPSVVGFSDAVGFDTLRFTDSYAAPAFDSVRAQLSPSAVPVPAAVWLFGSGLLGLVGVARRR